MSRIAIIGAGVIGLSWADLFAASGYDVAIYDVNASAIPDDRGYLIATSIADAVSGAELVQENGPERLEIKQQLLAEIAAAADDSTIIASSTSTLLPSLLAEGNQRAAQILVGHPYNPPEIMPLVEVVPGPDTKPDVVEGAVRLYRSVGKNPVALTKEVPGFVGNRIQKAVLDEAMWLVQQGMVDPAGFDEIMRGSLGLRWAATGVFEASHLGGGPGGVAHLMEHVGTALNAFDLQSPSADPDSMGALVAAVEHTYGDASNYSERVVRRDRITGALAAAAASEQQIPVLYALDIAQGRVSRVSPDSGEVTDLVTGLAEAPDGIVVDSSSGYAYITMMGVPDGPPAADDPHAEPAFTTRNGSIQRVPLSGGPAHVVVERGTFTTGKQLTTDPATGQLYWCDREGKGVYRCERDGSGVVALVLTTGRGPTEAEEHCVGIAVDPLGGYLYWTQKGPADGGRGRILRSSITIPDGQSAANRTDIETLWHDLPEPIDLHLDVRNNEIYWTDRGVGERGNTLNRAPIPAPGQTGVPATVLATGFREAIGVAIDDRHGVAYVNDLSGAIRSVDLTTGAERLVTQLPGAATGIALDWVTDAQV